MEKQTFKKGISFIKGGESCYYINIPEKRLDSRRKKKKPNLNSSVPPSVR